MEKKVKYLEIYHEKIETDEDGRQWITFNGSHSYALDKWTPEKAREAFTGHENYFDTLIAEFSEWGWED